MITTVDVGATKTLIAQFNDDMQPVNELRFATPELPADFMRELTKHLAHLTDITTISIAVPGIADKGVVLRCGILPWKNFALKEQLAQGYSCPILVENDADLAGLAEINALSPAPLFGLYITISTGIGTGLIVSGQLMPGLHRTEGGHMLVQQDGQWRIWEDLASGQALKRHFGKMAKELTKPEEWQWVAQQVSLGLYGLIPALQPDVIVFGGGVGGYFDKFSPYLIERLQRTLPKYIPVPMLRVARHPEEAVIYGCYQHAINHHGAA